MRTTMDVADALDASFREAVAAIDAGDVERLRRLLAEHPELVRERLEAPGEWLRGSVGEALDGYFHAPYLLWFVAGNPVRNEMLPRNVVDVARTVVEAARGEREESLQEQLDVALELVATGRVARESGLQIALIDALLDAGAAPGPGYGALAHGNLGAARRLLERGGERTLAAAACLGDAEESRRLAETSSEAERRDALSAAAINGLAEAVRLLLHLGVDPNGRGTRVHPHASALHHAVWSGSMETVEALLAAGADASAKDSVWGATPLDWAEHTGNEAIVARLRDAVSAE